MGMSVLVSEPRFFDVLEKDKYGNMHMDPENRPNCPLALVQHEQLPTIYRILGIRVFRIKSVEGLFDMTFTANCGFTFKKGGECFILLSNFRPERRRGEQAYFRQFFRDILGYRIIEFPLYRNSPTPLYFEGAGDAIPFGGTILAGHRFRTSRETMPYLCAITGMSVIPLELAKPELDEHKTLYHLDTTMIVFDEDHTIIAYPEAFTELSYKSLKYEVARQKGRLLEASYEDAANLALNAVVIPKSKISFPALFRLSLQRFMELNLDDSLRWQIAELISEEITKNEKPRGVVITSDAASDALLHMIRSIGYYPITVPLSEFLKAGGGAFCLTKILCE